ncbi:MAG: PHP domain-containing protein [Ruminococcaceae bacterium]|nr:PHP domain-containing protein [Oscillospiraceae bacterium]
MTRYFYDLHIHSCLSPCGDDDATPANIAAMAALNGLQIVALTDHNTCRNCPSFFKAAKALGLIPIAGMELTTAEDIHVICLFPTLEQAMAFNDTVDSCRIKIPNKTAVFGHQYLMDEDETILGEEPDLLINATTLSLEDAFSAVNAAGGICYPAHIDRTSNGIVAMLGAFPDEPAYTAYELHDADADAGCREKFPRLASLTRIVSSDAHELGAVSEAENSVLLEDEPYSSRLVTDNLFALLRGNGE